METCTHLAKIHTLALHGGSPQCSPRRAAGCRSCRAETHPRRAVLFPRLHIIFPTSNGFCLPRGVVQTALPPFLFAIAVPQSPRRAQGQRHNVMLLFYPHLGDAARPLVARQGERFASDSHVSSVIS